MTIFELIEPYYELIIIGLGLLILLISIRILFYNRRLRRQFEGKKFHLLALHSVDSLSKEDFISLSIFNNNIYDLRVLGFGFKYHQHNLDYYTYYQEQFDQSPAAPVTIASRDSVKVKMEAHALKNLLLQYSRGKRRIKKLEAYVIDAQGMTTSASAKTVRQVINRILKQEDQQKAAEEKAIHQAKRQVIRQERKQKNQERIARFKMRLKERSRKVNKKKEG